MSLVAPFREQLAALRLAGGRALVAVSGGPDSVALLDLLAQTVDVHGQELVVAHVDHGIQPDSARVAEQVQALAQRYQLPFHGGRLGLGPATGETRAREERYAWLEGLRLDLGAGFIFTAHHADDQIETVLMRVLAGSGPAGLAGMAPVRGPLLRPLLSFRRAELLSHLEEAGLGWWLDPANSDPRHLRSWIRTALLPVLRQRVPRVDANLLRTSRQSGRDRGAWDALLDALPGLDLRAEVEGISVAASSVGGYDSALSHALILAAARRAGCRLGPARLGRVVALLASGSSGALAPLGDGWSAEIAFGRLRIFRPPGPPPREVGWRLEGETGAGMWGRWSFHWSVDTVPDRQDRTGLSAWFPVSSLTVRPWLAGEKLQPLGGRGRRLVVRCFQAVRVPRSRRESWPVVAKNQDIIWIPGVCRSDIQLPSPGSEALRVDAEYA